MRIRDVKEKFYKAACDGDVDSLQRILDACPDILRDIASSSSSMSKTPLHAAVEGGNVDCCRIILEKRSGFDRQTNEYGCLPLHLAVTNASSNIVKLLLSRGHPKDCSSRDSDGRMPIHLAAIRGQKWVLEELLRHKHELYEIDDEEHCSEFLQKTVNGDNPIHLCIKHNNLMALKELVEYSLERNAAEVLKSQDQEGNTPMHIAVIHKRSEMVRYLLSTLGRVGAHLWNGDNLTPMQVWEQFGEIDDFRSMEISDMLSDAISHHSIVPTPYNGEKSENLPWFQNGIFRVFEYDEQWTKEMGGKILTMTSIVVGACMLIGVTLLGFRDTEPVSESIHAHRRTLLHSISISGLIALIMVHIYLLGGFHLWRSKLLSLIVIVLLSALTVFMGVALVQLSTLVTSWEPSWDLSAYLWIFWGSVAVISVFILLRFVKFVMELTH